MPKSIKSVVNQRIDEVMRLQIAGATYLDIRKYASEKEWNVSPRQVQRYIRSALEQMHKVARKKQKHVLAKQLLQMGNLYAAGLRDKKIPDCLNVLKHEANLLGLHAKDQRKRVEQVSSGHPSLAPLASRRDRHKRMVRYVLASACGDTEVMKLIEKTSPVSALTCPDYLMVLKILTVISMSVQLELQAEVTGIFMIRSMTKRQKAALPLPYAFVIAYQCYLFKARRDGWIRFLKSLSLNPDQLNSFGIRDVIDPEMVELLYELAPAPSDLLESFKVFGSDVEEVPTVTDFYQFYRRSFRRYQ